MDWIIICNTKEYDIEGAFNKLSVIDWKQSTSIQVDDIVYIYVGQPVQAIAYKCRAAKVDLSDTDVDDTEFVIDGTNYETYGRYMELELLEKYNDPRLRLDILKENGFKSVQGPSRVTSELSSYLFSVTGGKKELPVSNKGIKDITGEEPEDSESVNLIQEKLDGVLDNLIKQYKKELPVLLPEMQELEQLRVDFVNHYNMNRIKDMTKEEYVVGRGSKDSFCYRIENELQGLGNIHGATSTKFGLYYGKSGDDKEEKYRCTKKYGENPDEALEEIKKQIIFLRMDGEKKDLEAIRNCELAPLFRGKILSVFFPDTYLNVFASDHLDYFMLKLGIPVEVSDDILSKQVKLVEWKNKKEETKTWNNQIFSSFLYKKLGRPFEEERENKDAQVERDKKYPRDYVSSINVTINQWKELIQDSEVFTEDNIELMKRIYLADNHAKTCYDLGMEDGVSPTSYIKPIVALARRISNALSLDPVFDNEGKETWWRILFWGAYREDNHFEWKLRPKLVKAMAAVYPDLDSSESENIEEQEDNNLVSSLKQTSLKGYPENYEYMGKAKQKQAPLFPNGHKVYPRDRQTAINALAHAKYECECQVGDEHPTFIRRSSDKNYTEPHHLVPMSESERFEVSLDVEENIVSLCSNCHNKIHYGRDAKEMITQLYKMRQSALESVGISISLEELLKVYKVQ